MTIRGKMLGTVTVVFLVLFVAIGIVYLWAILFTSSGLLTDRQAESRGIGEEVLALSTVSILLWPTTTCI